MNILHMRYAIEVAKAGSINKASEALLIAQPNLSRSIKELEADLGIMIFERSARGMILTPEGEEFLGYAQKIIDEIQDVEKLYKSGSPVKQRFSISVPRASYISQAFANFSKTLTKAPAELYYQETNAQTAIQNITSSNYKLAIIRYANRYDRYFKEMLEEKSLRYELIAEFNHLILTSKDSPLLSLPEIHFSDLYPLIEITHSDPYVPSLHLSDVRKAELDEHIARKIFIFERGSQFEILEENPSAFLWTSPVPKHILQRHGLVQLRCADAINTYKDLLICRNNYKFSKIDNQFISELVAAKRRYFS